MAQIPGGKNAPTRLRRLSGDVKNAAMAAALAPDPPFPADLPSRICTPSAITMSRMLPMRMSASFFRLTLMNRIMTTTRSETTASGMTGSARYTSAVFTQ